KRRNVDGTVASGVKGKNSIHGFTSHEMLDSIGLIHMNGRVYDPTIGRFISADPTIDGADGLQGYNRYAYVHNNPATLSDPDGYGLFSKLTKEIGRAVTTVLDNWLGTCSKSKGDCGISIGATYGPNNSGIGRQSDSEVALRPKIGFGGGINHDDYVFQFKYDGYGLNLDRFYVPDQYALPGNNYFDVTAFRAANKISYSLEDANLYFDNPQDMAAKLRAGGYGSDEEKAARRAWLKNELGDDLEGAGYAYDAMPVRKELAYALPIVKVPGMGLRALGRMLKGNPCGCFDDDTPVLTKDGYKRIVEIKEGDLVLARHEETGEIAYKPVKLVFVVPNRRIYLLKTIDSLGQENIIEVSDDHPFWVIDKKWVNSIDLKEGDQLLDAKNQVHKVVSITETDRVETTYNLEVDGYHTYFAGDASIWVHNNDCLSSFNPVGKAISKAYDDILLGNGTKRPTTFAGRAPHEKPWAGSIEYEVPGAANPGVTRILQKPNGQMGITFDHYKTITPFPSPWYKDGGTRDAYNKAIKNGIK
ncbi:polymorphic toxin-type HINT domain-containing protein, partial [Acinetobacter seifertii]